MAVNNQLSYLPSGVGSARCQRCHRVLTDPESIQAGMGPECRGRSMRAGSGLCKREEFSDTFDNSTPFDQALVLKRSDMQQPSAVITNVPHLVVHHSPNGYEFGYGGSGPADLALNVCQFYLNMTGYEGKQSRLYDGKCWSLAWTLHQKFKQEIVALVPMSGASIPFSTIDAWFRSNITPELVNQFSTEVKE